jgi:hypothetical protein
MAEIEVAAQDVTDAEAFLEEYLSDKVTDGDYTDGAALRDLVIKAIAFNFAYLRKTADQLRVRQSLLTISEVDTTDDEEAADDAVDEILSNWFGSRNQGTYVRITGYGHATQPIDISIRSDTVFYKTAELPFLLDNNDEDLFIPAEELTPLFDSSGEITDYIFPIPLIAELPGKDFEIEAGAFASFDAFNPYVTRIETLEKGSGGEDTEESTDYISRAQNLITVRNLINARSNDAVLRDEFEDIKGLLTVGMGDPEMIRDLIREPATGLELHVGAHMDVYVFANTVETSFTGVVGEQFERPDGIINIFRDLTYADYDADTNPTGHKFTQVDPVSGLLVQPGMSLRIREGFVIDAHDYIIREVRDTELIVSEKVPFPTATDEAGTNVKWSIGHYMPGYEDVVSQHDWGETSKKMQTPGRVTLPGGPVYRVKDVTINDPSDPDSSADDGLVHFNVRTNTTPTEQVAPDNEYQVLVNNPENHQSKKSFTEIVVGISTDPDKYDGKTLKVTYETLVGFDSVHNYIADRRRRVSAANPLARGYHPAYVSFTMEYRLTSTATEDVDEEEVRDYLVSYINNFNPQEVMSVNVLMDAVRAAFPDIGRIYPFVIYYDVHVPDGRVVEFESEEEVTVPWTLDDLTAVLVETTSGSVDTLLNPGDYGLSDDVIRYLTTSEAINVEQRV